MIIMSLSDIGWFSTYRAVGLMRLFVLALVGSAQGQSAGVPPAAIIQVERSIAAVECVMLNAQNQVVGGTTIGTGFFVDYAGHVLTAAYVVDRTLQTAATSGYRPAIAIPVHGYPADYGVATDNGAATACA